MREVTLALEYGNDPMRPPNTYVTIRRDGELFTMEVADINHIVIGRQVLGFTVMEWIRELIA